MPRKVKRKKTLADDVQSTPKKRHTSKRPTVAADEPLILSLGKVELDKKTLDEMKTLTEGLTAQQWNQLLSNLHAASGADSDHSIVYYTLFYDEDARLQMLKTALAKDLEYLFKSMAKLAYVPRSPAVISLLEEGMAKYPNLRKELLFTMYSLGHPIERWHFTSSDEDLQTFKKLFSHSVIKREEVVKRLFDITEMDSAGLVELLMERGLVTRDDFCDTERYYQACRTGKPKYLRWTKEFFPEIRPDQRCVDGAASAGH